MAKSFMQAMAEHFGPKSTAPGPNKTLQEFSQELKKLTIADKQWYATAMAENGYECEAPKEA